MQKAYKGEHSFHMFFPQCRVSKTFAHHVNIVVVSNGGHCRMSVLNERAARLSLDYNGKPHINIQVIHKIHIAIMFVILGII